MQKWVKKAAALLILCLSFQIISSALTLEAQAETARLTMAVPFLTCAKEDKIITITVNVGKDSNVEMFDFGLTYDASKVVFQSAKLTDRFAAFLNEQDGAFFSDEIEKYQYIAMGGVLPQAAAFTGAIAEVTFLIKDGVSADFGITTDSALDYDKLQADGGNQILSDIAQFSDQKTVIFQDASNTEKPIETINPINTNKPNITTRPAQSELPRQSDAPIQAQPPKKIDNHNIVPKDEAVQAIKNKISGSNEKKIEIAADVAPTLNQEIFEAMLMNGKNVSVSITDESQNLLYAWGFNNRTIEIGEQEANLSIEFGDVVEESKEMAKVAGTDDILSMKLAHNGRLPGVASLNVYVGAQFVNGETIYLYRYQSKNNESLLTLLSKEGLIVKDGYVECQIDSGNAYFFSTRLLEDVEEQTVTAREWIYGDANLDQNVDLTDANEVLLAALGIKTQTMVAKAASDVNLDQKVDLTDANGVLLIALQIKTLDEIQGTR